MNPNITTIDIDGDGINYTRLPGIGWNAFGRSAGVDDVRKAVEAYNADVVARAKPLPANATAAQMAACTLVVSGQRMCGPRTPRNQAYPLLALPAAFSNGDKLLTTDLRVTRVVAIGEKVRLNLIGEGFNMFNVSNLGGYSSNLQAASFGNPTTRVNQIFGSGGPRAFQIAARLSF
jgi:hypothetical protein